MSDKNNSLKELRAENPVLFDKLMCEHEASNRYDIYSKIDSQSAWKRFRKEKYSQATDRDRRYALRYLLAAAAVVCVLGMCVVVLFQKGTRQDRNPQVARTIETVETRHEHDMRTTASSSNESLPSVPSSTRSALAPMPASFFESGTLGIISDRQVITSDKVIYLEDGTTVWLNSGATLKYPKHFEAGNRTVFLEGEAYFQVHSEAKRPFYVRTANGMIREYGTSFNVDAMTMRTIVTLVEGSISVYANGGAEQNILPGEQAIMSASSQMAQIHKIDVTNTIAWKTGIYRIDNETLEDVALKLQARYGCKVIFQSENVKGITFSGILNLNHRLTTILSAISFATDVRIRYMDDVIIFE
mgnify:CR=1 FL=1